MEVIVKMMNSTHERESEISRNRHISEFSEGYLELELLQKEQMLNEYLNAYNEVADKECFNAQYLKILISELRIELNK